MTTSRAKTALRLLFSLFFAFHVLTVLIANIPSPLSSLERVLWPVDAYLAISGNAQNWSMFHSIPLYSALSVETVVTDSSGQVHRLGPVLPDFRSLTADDQRLQHLFIRTMFISPPSYYLRGYVRRVCGMLKTSGLIVPREVRLEAIFGRVKEPARVREEGSISQPEVKKWGPEPCP